jgi:hypothetical protein
MSRPAKRMLPYALILMGLGGQFSLTAQAQMAPPESQPAVIPPGAVPGAANMLTPIADMRSLVQQGRYLEAFDLALKNDYLMGEPLYDYYFGIAAVDSGRASLGVLALERVLLTNPGNDLARLELARGYFVLKDYERSKEEFTLMAAKQLPPAVRASVDKYLSAIREQDPAFRRVVTAYAEYTVGRNSNVNSSVDGEVPFPLFGRDNPPIFVEPSAAKRSALTQLAVGGQVSGPVVPGIKYLASIDVTHRQYASIQDFDQTSGSISGGFEFAGERNRYRTFGYFSQAMLNGKKLRNTTGAAVDWGRALSAEIFARSSYSFSQLRYTPENKQRNADLSALSIGLGIFLGGPWKFNVDNEITYGKEKNLSGASYLSREIRGGRIALGFSPASRWQCSISVSRSRSIYDGLDPVGVKPETKLDTLTGLEFAVQYQLTKGWSTRGELIRSENKSNEPLYEFKQDIALLKMRYEWK